MVEARERQPGHLGTVNSPGHFSGRLLANPVLTVRRTTVVEQAVDRRWRDAERSRSRLDGQQLALRRLDFRDEARDLPGGPHSYAYLLRRF